MKELERTETHRRHRIRVTVTQEREHAWRWAYAIDDDVFGKSPRLLPDEETAWRLGTGAARARVDELEG
jgi:hypothetical protein